MAQENISIAQKGYILAVVGKEILSGFSEGQM